MPYNISNNAAGCSGYAVVLSNTGKVVGCHPTKEKAQAHLAALYTNVEDVKKCMTCGCDDLGNDHHYISDTEKCTSCIDKGQGPCWEGYEYSGTKENDNGKTVPNCIPVKKSDGGYQPNAGMKAAARRALKWKEQGKATGAGTPVGWGRATDIVAGRSMSLDTVKRMYSFFSRHEVDKKGKDWDKPSNGKIMWNAWGGDAGFAWSRAIVEREKKIEKEIWRGAFSPIEKKKDKYEHVISQRNGEPADEKLYAKVIAEAKRKFDVYPSAYANGWVVQEYKRRGGKYKINKESAGSERLSGGPGFKIEFNVPDCQGGYAVMKAGSGQVIGCYTTKQLAQEAMDAIAVNEPNLTKTENPVEAKADKEQQGIGAFSFWNGSFAPVFGSIFADSRFNSTYNSPPQKDGKPSAGYGNRSGKGNSNS
jgi:Family of unknown function (DUF5872)